MNIITQDGKIYVFKEDEEGQTIGQELQRMRKDNGAYYLTFRGCEEVEVKEHEFDAVGKAFIKACEELLAE